MRQDTKLSENLLIPAAESLGATAADIKELKEDKFRNEKSTNKKISTTKGFLRNNIVKSPRFRYLIRYCSAKNIHDISKQTILLELVFKKLVNNDLLLRKYIDKLNFENNKCYDITNKNRDTYIKEIIKRVSHLEFNKIINYKGVSDIVTIKNIEINQALIKLYYLLVYTVVKNFIYINNRYVMAFYALERDTSFYLGKKYFKGRFREEFEKLQASDSIVLTNTYVNCLDEDHIKELSNKPDMRSICCKQLEYIKNQNKQNKFGVKNIKSIIHYDFYEDKTNQREQIIRFYLTPFNRYRNLIDHLSILNYIPKKLDEEFFTKNKEKLTKKSNVLYFRLYHYVLESVLKDEFKKELKNTSIFITLPNKIQACLNCVEQYKNYSKDFLKIISLPFAYNTARYNKLVNENLFDMNIE